MAAVTMEDLLKPRLALLTQEELILVSQGLSLLYGGSCIAVAALASFLDWGVLQGSFTVMGVVSGPLLGVFVLGMFVPAANRPGAFTGLLVGFCVSLWLAVGSSLYPPSEDTMGVLPSYAGQCGPGNRSLTSRSLQNQRPTPTGPDPEDQGGLMDFYALSYLYFGALATSSVVLVGLMVSYATGATQRSHIKAGLLWWDLNTEPAQTGSRARRLPCLQPNACWDTPVGVSSIKGVELTDPQLQPLRVVEDTTEEEEAPQHSEFSC